MIDGYVDVANIVLQKMKYMAILPMSGEMVREFAMNPKLDSHLEEQVNIMRFMIVQEVYAQKLEDARTAYPADWKEAVKESFFHWLGSGYTGHFPFFGDLFRNTFPIWYLDIELTAWKVYPHINPPSKDDKIVFRKMVQKRKKV